MKSAKFRFPRRAGNRFRLLVDDDEFFPVMLEAIGAARTSVLREGYLFESGLLADRFIAVLTIAATHGVCACLLLDDFGSRLLLGRDHQRPLDSERAFTGGAGGRVAAHGRSYREADSVRRLGQRHYGSLLRSGVRIFEYQPRFLHAKVQLCDNGASIGSNNLDRWNLRCNLEANHELDDPDILRQLERGEA